MDALFGHTGFVGGNLMPQHAFGSVFNRTNISDSKGQRFDVAVCAAAPGSMLEANRLPERDAERVEQLMEHLAEIRPKRFVLISTIAVFGDFTAPAGEATTSIEPRTAYGRNRRMLELFCERQFDNCLVVRLPALFGSRLRKNFLFDLLNPVPTYLPPARVAVIQAALPTALGKPFEKLYAPANELGLCEVDRSALDASSIRSSLEEALMELRMSALEFTHPESRFQFYNLARLWADISIGMRQDLAQLHLAPEPLQAGAVFRAFNGAEMPATSAAIHVEDMRTQYASFWNSEPPYSAAASDALADVRAFMQHQARST